MGPEHADTKDDLTGIDMYVLSTKTVNGVKEPIRQLCVDSIDGSGSYHCGHTSARYGTSVLRFVKSGGGYDS